VHLRRAQGGTNPHACNGRDLLSASLLKGQRFSPALEERIRKAAGAQVVRILRPGDPSSMEIQSNRVNIQIDSSESIIGFWCG
jgi:hypothetical protein